MKILYVSQYFPPEMGAPAARAAELAHHWAAAGHGVSVLTGFPNHPTGSVPEEWRARLRHLTHHERISVAGAVFAPEGGMLQAETGIRMSEAATREPVAGTIDVFRTWLWPLPNRKAHERIRNYTSFFLSAALRGLTLPSPDVIIATSPQLLVALAGWWLAFARGIPFVFEVRDLWPESLTAVGIGQESSLLHRTLAGIAGFLYERADRIVVVTLAFREYLIERWRVPPDKIAVIENGVETDLFAPQPQDCNFAVRRQLGVDGKFLACYIGTIGMAHRLETLLEAAADLQANNRGITFLVIGEGAEKERIRSVARERGLANVLFFDQQPREKIPAFISASDACVVLLRKTDVFKTVIPTKMLEFMSCARPVVLAVEGQAQEIIEKARAGIVIEPENASALACALSELAANPDERTALGQQGREYILRHFSRAHTADKYIQVLEAMLK